MKNKIEKAAGISLLIGSFLMFVTMVLHPVGGDFEHILRVRVLNMTVHSIALVSIPFTWIGFRGVTNRLSAMPFLSQTAYAFITFALVAVMLAATMNGLVLANFTYRYAEASSGLIDAIKPILHFNSALNHAYDYIFIVGICVAVLLWSLAIIKTGALSKWLGWLGIVLSLAALGMGVAGFVFVNLHGFQIFVFGVVAWTVLAGIGLMRPTPDSA